jgi:SAM-dependent methyltransferase
LIPGIELHGCDINPELIAWCSANIPFGSFKPSTVLPPLPYPSNHFDILYGVSVLTHLLFDAHQLWASEIWRVLKPGGIAVLTAQGPSLFPQMARQIANGLKSTTHRIDAGMFIGLGQIDGPNETGNTLTCDVMEKLFFPFEKRIYRPCFGLMGTQDSYVFYKNSSAELHHVPELFECKMAGKEFQAEIALPTDHFGKCAFLVAARNLIYPASMEFSISFQDSAMLPVASNISRLPEKATWTELEAAYAFVSIDEIPRSDGPAKLSVKCTGERHLDGATLLVHNARFL